LNKLDPFIDSDGIIQVGGRLERSDIPYNSMHPIILPKESIRHSIPRFETDEVAQTATDLLTSGSLLEMLKSLLLLDHVVSVSHRKSGPLNHCRETLRRLIKGHQMN
jgi:hypothetical protein